MPKIECCREIVNIICFLISDLNHSIIGIYCNLHKSYHPKTEQKTAVIMNVIDWFLLTDNIGAPDNAKLSAYVCIMNEGRSAMYDKRLVHVLFSCCK